MRATDYLLLVIVIGLTAIAITLSASDLNTIYTSEGNQINNSDFDSYNDFQDISNRANSTFENFKKLGDDTKWYQKIGAGIVAIPYAVISFPLMIADAIVILTKFMGLTLPTLIPQSIILGLLAILMVEVVRRMMEFFQRSRS